METVEKKVVKKICKYCHNYHRKNAKRGRCELTQSTRKLKENVLDTPIEHWVNRDNSWTCEKFAERV